MKLVLLIKLMRPGNALMAAVGILIGFLYSGKALSLDLLWLMLAGVTALGFGNVINDILDIETDRISHPDRPLVTGALTLPMAWSWLLLLGVVALGFGFAVSPTLGLATTVPLLLLLIYSLLLKGTPLAGNITVSLLIAYTLMYGAWGGNYVPLFFPALLAMLTNICREVIKDVADAAGDRAAGIVTTASLPAPMLSAIIIGCGSIAMVVAPVPTLLGEMGTAYLTLILVGVAPLFVGWMKAWHRGDYSKAASLLKIKMLVGLAAILLDRFVG